MNPAWRLLWPCITNSPWIEKTIVFLVNFPHQPSRGHQRNTVQNPEACKPAGTPSKAYSPEMGQEGFTVTRPCFEVFLKLILFFQPFVRLSKTKFRNIVYWGHVSGRTKMIIKLWNALQKKKWVMPCINLISIGLGLTLYLRPLTLQYSRSDSHAVLTQ